MTVTAETITERPRAHIRIVRTEPKGSGWCGGPARREAVENRTACGGEMTSYDVSPRDAAKMLHDPKWRDRVCLECAAWNARHVSPVNDEPDECATCLGARRIRDGETGHLRKCLDCNGTGHVLVTPNARQGKEGR